MSGDGHLNATQKMNLLEQLSGRRLHAVTFILDYVQLQFDPPLTINAFARVSVRPNGEKVRGDDDDQFRNLLCAQISKVVGLVVVRDSKSFDLGFSDGSEISISLRPEDYVCPEAVAVAGDGYLLVL
jgi:hypothetical protein